MEHEGDPRAELQALEALLRRLTRRMTRREWATPRLVQVDAGNALALLLRVSYPKHLLLRRALTEVLREAGKRRPDYSRHILVLETAAAEIAEELDEPHWS